MIVLWQVSPSFSWFLTHRNVIYVHLTGRNCSFRIFRWFLLIIMNLLLIMIFLNAILRQKHLFIEILGYRTINELELKEVGSSSTASSEFLWCRQKSIKRKVMTFLLIFNLGDPWMSYVRAESLYCKPFFSLIRRN